MAKVQVSADFHGKKYTIETGVIAKQAHGAVLVTCGETVVLATAVAADKPREGVDFFPLTVDFIEKYYASGKIPGSFFKREARPSTDATLTARLIDRPIRPLFPNGFRNDVNIVVTVLSYDGVNTPDHLGMVAASAALSISKIPFQGPIGGVVVGRVDGKLIINPSPEELEKSTLELSIAGTREAVMMVEAEVGLLTEEQMLEALEYGHAELKKLIDLQEELIKKAGVPKMPLELVLPDENLVKNAHGKIGDGLQKALATDGKLAKYAAIDAVQAKLLADLKAELGEETFAKKEKEIREIFHDAEKTAVRSMILDEGKRLDGRKMDELRPLSSEVGLFKRTHGSALFTRGETQALVLTTLGTADDEQMIDGLDPTYKKQFFLHYNFPPYSVGEVGRMGSPGRRELGHGNLAERGLKAIIPPHKDFPYTIRVVSEITESNGSSSMASICGGTLSLMDAGVPIKAPVAGIAMGLIKENHKFQVLTDIMGLEDHLGDMDFKVAGTRDGITALQMDIKIVGVTSEVMKQALAQAKVGRMTLLDHLHGTISTPRGDLNKYAPRIESLMIPVDRIGELIGPGGKTIKKIQETYNVEINIEEDGKVDIASADGDSLRASKDYIAAMMRDVEVGDVFEDAKVVKIIEIGAFVEVAPGKQGLVHISEIAPQRIAAVTDVLSEGQTVKVKCVKIDERGRYNFTIKNA
ncbi:polyribonucleotide nucleotidyltransferase [Candidatus Termititenax aidoneus]|uniref:Polyribonucleotide nucleotidyltransferase n=1 Tax=Termititenax aidoneus TaxID=2218524 RepID=A0A388T8Z1_TERA1|nr:polyribonucleotide nucleotidyltransferase [Candidatus Termititenax aidoneus]